MERTIRLQFHSSRFSHGPYFGGGEGLAVLRDDIDADQHIGIGAKPVERHGARQGRLPVGKFGDRHQLVGYRLNLAAENAQFPL